MLDMFKFQSLTVKISPDFIRNPHIDGYIKMIVLLEQFYNYAVNNLEVGHSLKPYPANKFISACLGLKCRQTVGAKQKTAEYAAYSPRRGGKRYNPRRPHSVTVQNRLLITETMTVYEKLIVLDIICYNAEDEDAVSQRQIAYDLGIDRNTVRKLIKSLEGKGLITINSSGAVGLCNRYEVSENLEVVIEGILGNDALAKWQES